MKPKKNLQNKATKATKITMMKSLLPYMTVLQCTPWSSVHGQWASRGMHRSPQGLESGAQCTLTHPWIPERSVPMGQLKTNVKNEKKPK